MSAAAIALEIPDWLSACETVAEAKGKGARYVPSKIRDFLMEHVEGMEEHVRLFLLALIKRTYDGVGDPSQKSLAVKIDRCQRTVQYDIAQAEAAGFIKVKRRGGLENVYQLGIGLLIKAGALFLPKPRPPEEVAPKPSFTSSKKSPGAYKAFIPERPISREEAKNFLAQMRGELGKVPFLKDIFPPG